MSGTETADVAGDAGQAERRPSAATAAAEGAADTEAAPGAAEIQALIRIRLGSCQRVSHSRSFDQRRRPETVRTAMATAFGCPTSTTRRRPRVRPV